MPTMYILRSQSTGRFYIGSTSDIDRRIQEHQSGQALYTRGRGPWALVYQEIYNLLIDALRRERQVKSWKSRRSIEQLIAMCSVG